MKWTKPSEIDERPVKAVHVDHVEADVLFFVSFSLWLRFPNWSGRCCRTTLLLVRPKTSQTPQSSTSTRTFHSCTSRLLPVSGRLCHRNSRGCWNVSLNNICSSVHCELCTCLDGKLFVSSWLFSVKTPKCRSGARSIWSVGCSSRRRGWEKRRTKGSFSSEYSELRYETTKVRGVLVLTELLNHPVFCSETHVLFPS